MPALIRESRSAKSSKAFVGSASPIPSWSTGRTASWPAMAASRRRATSGWRPCLALRIEHMSAAEKRAYVVADNKLAINAGWDEELLALELKELMEADLGFDIGVTGFTIPEVDQLMEGLAPEEPGDPADNRLPDDRLSPRCKPGDLWRLGSHRLVCGDALDPAVVSALMDGEKAEMVFTDPPYNVEIEGNVSGLGKTRHREFAMASGEMSSDEFARFLSSAFANLVAHCAELKNLIVWAKDNGGMGVLSLSA